MAEVDHSDERDYDQERAEELREEILRLTEENNKLLNKLHRSQRFSRVMKIVYIVIIIGLAIASFYLIQPYVNNVLHVYSGGVDALKNLPGLGS